MNIARTPIHAPENVHFRGRQALVRALVLGCAMACASVTAFAGQDRERDRDGRNSQQPQQAQQTQQTQQAQPNRDVAPPRAERAPAPLPPSPPPQRVDPRQGDAHAYDEQRRQTQQQDQSSRRGGRLTPDERAELRRQINEAGVELYPNTPRR